MLIALETILWVFRFVIGTCVFSFLNVVIYRFPLGVSVVKGRSYCRDCGHDLSAWEIIPLVSYCILGGKCRCCGQRISPRYFVVESMGGVAFCLCSYFFGDYDSLLISLQGLLVFVFLAVLTVVALIDWDFKIIFNRFHMIVFFLGVLALFVFPEIEMRSRIIGALMISVPMFGLALFVPGSFGGGDVKLCATCGFFLGVKAMAVGTFFGFVAGGVYAMAMLAMKKIGRKDHFAFGPFLAAGFAVAVFAGKTIADWYLGILGF